MLCGANAAVWFGLQPTAPIRDTSVSALPDYQADLFDTKSRAAKPVPRVASVAELEADARLAAAPQITKELATQKPVDAIDSRCMIWGAFNPELSKKAQTKLETAQLLNYSVLQTKQSVPFLVRFGPFNTDAKLNARIKSLKAAKITDFNVQDDDSIAVAMLSTRDAADKLKVRLDSLGLKGAEIISQNRKVTMSTYKFASLNEAERIKLIRASQAFGTVQPCSLNSAP